MLNGSVKEFQSFLETSSKVKGDPMFKVMSMGFVHPRSTTYTAQESKFKYLK